MDVPNYSFEHEEKAIAAWRIDSPHAEAYSFAYLILEPKPLERQSRAVVLVDSIDHPKKVFFLAGPKMLSVPELARKPFDARIDKPLSYLAKLVVTSGPLTINVAGEKGQSEQIKLNFAPALKDLYEKFERAPCLTIPDVLTVSRGERTTSFVALLKNGKPNDDFDSRCGNATDNLVPPTFSHIATARLRFAFTNQRIVVHHKNYVISIPYDVDYQTTARTSFLLTEMQLKKVLTEFHDFPDDRDGVSETVDNQVKELAFAIQHRIDAELAALLRAKGGSR
jgi:hypothetical protein